MKSPTKKAEKGKTRDGGERWVEESRGRSEKRESGSRNEARKEFSTETSGPCAYFFPWQPEGQELPVAVFPLLRTGVQVRGKKYTRKAAEY